MPDTAIPDQVINILDQKSVNSELCDYTGCIFCLCCRKGGGVFWKLLGLTLAGAGGAVGYAWYDPGFRKTVEDNIPYSQDAFSLVYQYLPPSPEPADVTTPSVDHAVYVTFYYKFCGSEILNNL
jgi:Mitochondrial inner membrane protein